MKQTRAQHAHNQAVRASVSAIGTLRSESPQAVSSRRLSVTHSPPSMTSDGDAQRMQHFVTSIQRAKTSHKAAVSSMSASELAAIMQADSEIHGITGRSRSPTPREPRVLSSARRSSVERISVKAPSSLDRIPVKASHSSPRSPGKPSKGLPLTGTKTVQGSQPGTARSMHTRNDEVQIKQPSMKHLLALKEVVELSLRNAEAHDRARTAKLSRGGSALGNWRSVIPSQSTTDLRLQSAQGVRLSDLPPIRPVTAVSSNPSTPTKDNTEQNHARRASRSYLLPGFTADASRPISTPFTSDFPLNIDAPVALTPIPQRSSLRLASTPAANRPESPATGAILGQTNRTAVSTPQRSTSASLLPSRAFVRLNSRRTLLRASPPMKYGVDDAFPEFDEYEGVKRDETDSEITDFDKPMKKTTALTKQEIALHQRFSVRRIFIPDVHGALDTLHARNPHLQTMSHRSASRASVTRRASHTALHAASAATISPKHTVTEGNSASEAPTRPKTAERSVSPAPAETAPAPQAVAQPSPAVVKSDSHAHGKTSTGARTVLRIPKHYGFAGELPFLGNAAPNAVFHPYNYATMATSMTEVNMYKEDTPSIPGARFKLIAQQQSNNSDEATKHSSQSTTASHALPSSRAAQQQQHKPQTARAYNPIDTADVFSAGHVLTAQEKQQLRIMLLEKHLYVSDVSGTAKNLAQSDAGSGIAERRVAWMLNALRHDMFAAGQLKQRIQQAKPHFATSAIARNMSYNSLHSRTRENLASSCSQRWAEEEWRLECAAKRRAEIQTAWDAYISELMARHDVIARGRELREQQMTWLHIITLARATHVLERSLNVERFIRTANTAARDAATIIQARWRGIWARQWVRDLQATKPVLRKFAWRWRLRKSILRKRVYSAFLAVFCRDLVLTKDAALMTCALDRYIKHYRYCVIRAQRFVRAFLVCVRARKEALRLLWERKLPLLGAKPTTSTSDGTGDGITAIQSPPGVTTARKTQGRRPSRASLPPLPLTSIPAITSENVIASARDKPAAGDSVIACARDKPAALDQFAGLDVGAVLQQYLKQRRREARDRRMEWVRTTAQALLTLIATRKTVKSARMSADRSSSNKEDSASSTTATATHTDAESESAAVGVVSETPRLASLVMEAVSVSNAAADRSAGYMTGRVNSARVGSAASIIAPSSAVTAVAAGVSARVASGSSTSRYSGAGISHQFSMKHAADIEGLSQVPRVRAAMLRLQGEGVLDLDTPLLARRFRTVVVKGRPQLIRASDITKPESMDMRRNIQRRLLRGGALTVLDVLSTATIMFCPHVQRLYSGEDIVTALQQEAAKHTTTTTTKLSARSHTHKR